MKRSYTFLILNDTHREHAVTFSIPKVMVYGLIAGGLFLAFLCSLSIYYLVDLTVERTQMMEYKTENEQISERIATYQAKFDRLERRMTNLDDLGGKVETAMTSGLDPEEEKPEANTVRTTPQQERSFFSLFGSEKVKLPKDFSWEAFENRVAAVGAEISRKESSLTDLMNTLDEQQFVILSTPTIWPYRGRVTSAFGYRAAPFGGYRSFHEGIDISGPYGQNVRSTARGTVVFAGTKSGYGLLVSVDHGYGYVTQYGHNSRIVVRVGDKVEKGQTIAKLGSSGRSTGPHVHYEVLVRGRPVNPMPYIIR